MNGLDAVAFHYSAYRSFQRFLGMDSNLQVAYDVDVNFVSAWNEMFVDNDFINTFTGKIDPRHMYRTSNIYMFMCMYLSAVTYLMFLCAAVLR